MNGRIRIGIMGTGRIVAQWMRDVAGMEGTEVTAIASRDGERARKAAQQHGIALSFGSYEAMLAADVCDAVYIATPHTMHRDCAMLAMRAGKHVLCEKPIAPNAAQFREMKACAEECGVLLMEGMWTRFFPATQEVRRLVQSGEIGEARMIQADFSFHTPFETQTRMFDPAQAGGALLDVGCYGVHYAMYLYGAIPEQVGGTAVIGASGVDEQDVLALRFPGGRMASVACGLRVSLPDGARIQGTKGSIDVPAFWHPVSYTLTDEAGRVSRHFVPEGSEYAEAVKRSEGFAYEVQHFCDCIRQGRMESPVIPHADSLAALEVMDEFRAQIGLKYPFE